MEEKYFKVLTPMDIYYMRLPSHLEYGYEDKDDFEGAIRRLSLRWQNRIGERIDERHGFKRLRFHDTPGGKPDEEWLPDFMLVEVEKPEWMIKPERDEIEEEIERIFSFD